MRKNRWTLFLAAGLFLLLLPAFQRIDVEMKEAVEVQVRHFKEKKRRECRQRVNRRASEIVDSIILERAQFTFADTAGRPPRMPKPGFPEIIAPRDTSPVKKLWEDSM